MNVVSLSLVTGMIFIIICTPLLGMVANNNIITIIAIIILVIAVSPIR